MSKKTPATVNELLNQQQSPEDDLPRFVFDAVSDWLITTDSLVTAHRNIIKKAKAGEFPELSLKGLKCWKQDLKRLKSIVKIQDKMA